MREANRDGIKLSQLRALVAIAEHGNFSEAALHLLVSQSAISHAIASLEDELGVVLLSRGRHGAQLTPVGERITAHARQMLQTLEQIGKEANLAKGLEGGEIRIACFRSIATHVLPEIIAEFRSAYPAIAITINEHRGFDGIEQALREGRADIGFTCFPTPSEFEIWELLRDEYFVLFPPNFEIPNPLTMEHLRDYPLIMPPDDDHCSILIRRHIADYVQSVNIAYKIREDSTIVSMVSQGLGISVMAQLAAEPLPSDIQVRCLPTPLERVFNVSILRDALHPPAVFAFLDMLKKMDRFVAKPINQPIPIRRKTA